ncbi:GAF domain-containing protein [Streptomyces albidoflavus]|nr:GAF domain-containing protein [Streptomyces albidoflavus]
MTNRLHLPTPIDHEAALLQGRLGITSDVQRNLDQLAQDLAHAAGVPWAMVNIFGDHAQHFLGLAAPGPDSGLPQVGRHMDPTYGYCPEVRTRSKALVLPDVYRHPRFTGNPVVNEIGIRTYAGAPLLDEQGTTFGTVCFVGRHPLPRASGTPSLALIKQYRDAAQHLISPRPAR